MSSSPYWQNKAFCVISISEHKPIPKPIGRGIEKDKNNLNLAMIDERPYGGTCALRGCQPKKYLISNAEAVAMSRHLMGLGINRAARTNWQAMQVLKNQFLKGRSLADSYQGF